MKKFLFNLLIFVCFPLALLLSLFDGVMGFFKYFFNGMKDYVDTFI